MTDKERERERRKHARKYANVKADPARWEAYRARKLRCARERTKKGTNYYAKKRDLGRCPACMGIPREGKVYCATCAAKQHVRALAHYYNNREKRIEQSKKWKENNRERTRRNFKALRLHYRSEALRLLGGKCVRCGFSDPRALQVDHIDGDGWKDRESRSPDRGYWKEISTSLAAGVPLRLQLLCANCNWIKRYENGEHGLERRLALKAARASGIPRVINPLMPTNMLG